MDHFTNKDKNKKAKNAKRKPPIRPSVDELFKRATEVHQNQGLFQALSLYAQMIEQFPNNPKAAIAKTIVAGFQKEKIGIYWNAAADARSACNPDGALKFYNLIMQEYPDSSEAKSAKTEIKSMTDILQAWDAALISQSQGEEFKALELYKKIVENYSYSPEAENASLLISIIQQNQFMPQGEVFQDFQDKENTPAKIVSSLLAHKKATIREPGDVPPELLREERQSQKIEHIWQEAVELEKEGRLPEAALLLKKIIETSLNGHRVRDAKYLVEKIETRLKELCNPCDKPMHWGLLQDTGPEGRWKFRVRIIQVAVVALLVIGVAGFLLYRTIRPVTWTDVVDNAKRAVVVVRTAAGAGTGFLFSSDGLILTNAHLVGKEKDVEIRLYSGRLKRAKVIKVGMDLLDVAVLKIDGAYSHFMPLSVSEKCTEGEEIRAIGAPLGIEYFITKGIISHCSHSREGVRYIQTDTAINVGNSGGPCLNYAGRVIGLSTTINVGDNAQGLNLILPSTVIRDFMEGRLVKLEEVLIKKEAERARDREEFKKKFYADAEKVQKRLQNYSDSEYNRHAVKLDALHRQNAITYEKGQAILEQLRYPPWGPPSMTQWIQALALQVAKGDITEEAAIKLIKNHYDQ